MAKIKFYCETDRYLYDAAIDQCCPTVGEPSRDGIAYTMMHYAYFPPCLDEQLDDYAGCIISENDKGQVEVSYFETDGDLESAWLDVLDEVAEEACYG